MKKSLLIALFAAMPLVAQEFPQMPGDFDKMPPRPEGPRPELTEAQKAEMKNKMHKRFDADKDGRISDAEREAMKDKFQKRGPKHGKFDKQDGRRREGKGFGPRGQRPDGQRPELTEEQKAEMKARFGKRERGPKGPRPEAPMFEKN